MEEPKAVAGEKHGVAGPWWRWRFARFSRRIDPFDVLAGMPSKGLARETQANSEYEVQRRKRRRGKVIRRRHLCMHVNVFQRQRPEQPRQLFPGMAFGADAHLVIPQHPAQAFPRLAAEEGVLDPVVDGVNAVAVI